MISATAPGYFFVSYKGEEEEDTEIETENFQ